MRLGHAGLNNIHLDKTNHGYMRLMTGSLCRRVSLPIFKAKWVDSLERCRAMCVSETTHTQLRLEQGCCVAGAVHYPLQYQLT